MRHICICQRERMYLKLTGSETKSCSWILQKLRFLNNSKLEKTLRNNQVLPHILHLTAFRHGGLSCSSLSWGSSDNFKTMPVSKAGTVSTSTEVSIDPETTDGVKKLLPSALLVLVIPHLLNVLSAEQLIFLKRKCNSLPLD